jgi:hypothetical protein
MPGYYTLINEFNGCRKTPCVLKKIPGPDLSICSRSKSGTQKNKVCMQEIRVSLR